MIKDVYFSGCMEGDATAWKQCMPQLEDYQCDRYAASYKDKFKPQYDKMKAEPDNVFLFIITKALMGMWEYCVEKYNLKEHIIFMSKEPAYNQLYKGSPPKLWCVLIQFKEKK